MCKKMKLSKNVTLDLFNIQRIEEYAKKRGQNFSFALNLIVGKWYHINEEIEKAEEKLRQEQAKVLRSEK